MSNGIKYVLPGFLNFYLNESLIYIYENHAEVVTDDSCISSFFGCFPRAIWNGGRPDLREPEYSIKEIKKVRDFYDKKNIPLALTFTNPLIEEKHLNDEYCNNILKLLENGKNEVLVNSIVLEKYIRENYPGFKINKSITATEYIDYDLNGYNLSVIKKDRNHDFDFLKKINVKGRKNIEFLCNEACTNDCLFTFTHYEEMANIQLGLRGLCDIGRYGVCKHHDKYERHEILNWIKNKSKYYISVEDINTKYQPLGFELFKICGREKFSTYGLVSVIDYTIKQKYQQDVRTYIAERMLYEFECDYKDLLHKLGDKIIEDNQMECR